MKFIKENLFTIIIIVIALISYLFVDWSEINILNYFK